LPKEGGARNRGCFLNSKTLFIETNNKSKTNSKTASHIVYLGFVFAVLTYAVDFCEARKRDCLCCCFYCSFSPEVKIQKSLRF